MKNSFSFSFRLDPKRSLVAVIIASTLTFITVKCGISQNDVLKIYNEIRKGIKFDLPDENNIINEIDNQLNEKINRDPELLKEKIRTEVTDAIWRYEKETGDDGTVKIPPPRFLESKIDETVCYTPDCQSLGGEMRMCAPWVDGCDSYKTDIRP